MNVPEIDPSELEREIRAGARVSILDVRSDEDFAAWRLDTGSVPLSQRYWRQVVDDPAALAGLVNSSGPIRVICARGLSSQQAVRALRENAVDATSVTGGMIGWSQLLRHDEVPGVVGPRVDQFRREARGCLSYLVSCGGQALVVDPAPDVEPYLRFACEHDLTITRILDTHVHADHLSGLRVLADATGAIAHVSQGAITRGFHYGKLSAVTDGTSLMVGSAVLRVVSLPGHTTDNVGVLLPGQALIAGDSLFADSVARPDLEVGDSGAPRAARQLFRTIHEHILTLGDDMLLLPCHYPGGRIDRPIAPTLGQARDAVALLGLDEDAFIEQTLAAMPPRPLNYLDIIAVNLGAKHDDVTGLEVGANNCAATNTRQESPS